MTYRDFLATKAVVVHPTGREISDGAIHPSLFPFQADMVRWAVRKGRAALFEDTGLGKTRQQIEWARLTGERALILAPIAAWLLADHTPAWAAASDLSRWCVASNLLLAREMFDAGELTS